MIVQEYKEFKLEKQLRIKIQKLQERFDTRRLKLKDEFYSRLKLFQAKCKHNNVYTYYDRNPHRHETWEITYCLKCGKELSKV